MSYKHNNLMALRNNFWNDEQSERIQTEKQFLTRFLTEQQIFTQATLDDARYFFYSLPSIIIVKAYSLGFLHDTVIGMMQQFIELNREPIRSRQIIKIQYHL